MGKPDTPDAPEVNYSKDIKQFVTGVTKSMPSIYKGEQKWRDEFQGLNLRDVSGFLGGTNGQEGLYKQGRESMERAGDQIGDARRYDLTRMTGQADEVRGLLQKLDPAGEAMARNARVDARAAQQASMGLSGQERRSAEQFAREGAAAGRVGDNSTIAAGILNRDDILTRKRQEATAMGQNAFNMSNAFYSQPGLAMLNQTPQSYQAGQGYLSLGLGSIGAGKPQLIDPSMGLNLGAANRQNIFAANAAAAGQPNPFAKAGTGALSGAATGATLGSVVPGIGTGVGAVAGGIAGGLGGYYA